jgi:homoserine dehydrogenase
MHKRRQISNGVNVGIIGLGTIGSAVKDAILKNNSILKKRLGCRVNLKAVCDKNPKAFKGSKLKKDIIKRSPQDVIEDPDIDVVIELIGGINPAKEIISKALNNKKHVITANKALLADYKKELFKLAAKNNRGLYFESSVMAGVPVIKTLREGLIANRIESMWGIINGTSNYILSNMYNRASTFKKVLTEAKDKGIAEKDYSLDVEGIDSAQKLAIISSLAFGQDIKVNDIYVEGIMGISVDDIMYAKELGYTIKLLSIAKRLKDSIEVRVHPTLLPNDHILSDVDQEYNAIYINSDLARDIFLYGQGAGGPSTSSGILADLGSIVAAMEKKNFKMNSLIVESSKPKRIKNIDEIESNYYIRFMAIDSPGVLSKISGILGQHDISIASVVQKAKSKAKAVPIIMLIHKAIEKNIKKALNQIADLPAIKAEPIAIKIEQEEQL